MSRSWIMCTGNSTAGSSHGYDLHGHRVGGHGGDVVAAHPPDGAGGEAGLVAEGVGLPVARA